MTETDATKTPIGMPATFVPYIDRMRVHLLFREMVEDLLVALPKDHLRHIKMFLNYNSHTSKDFDRIIILTSPDFEIDIKKTVKELVKNLGIFVITRRCIIDHYEKHEEYRRGCMDPGLMAEVVKQMISKELVMTTGWLMFDHPCTIREARCLQQDGVLPSVTLVLMPNPEQAQRAEDPRTPARTYIHQNFDGLKYVYKATLKEVHIDKEDETDTNKIAMKCFNAIRAAAAGAQGPGQGFHAIGAPGVYRVLLIGPLGSGRKTQSWMLAKHFGLVVLLYCDIYKEAKERNDEIGEKLRKFGPSVVLKAEIVQRRMMQKDCLERGWVLNGYPENGVDFEHLDNMPTPPNRIIFLNCELSLCKERCMSVAVDWCTGQRVTESGPRAMSHPEHPEAELDAELEYFFTEALAELRAAAGMTAVDVSAAGTPEEVNTRLQAAVIAAPPFNVESPSLLRDVNAD